MHEIMAAMRSVERALTGAPHTRGWTSLVRNRLSGLRGAYISYLEHSMGSTSAAVADNPWLDARLTMLRRDQARVADEIDRLIDICRPEVDLEKLRHQVAALLGQVTRARQREVGLLYESVDMELGGEQ